MERIETTFTETEFDAIYGQALGNGAAWAHAVCDGLLWTNTLTGDSTCAYPAWAHEDVVDFITNA